MAAEGKSAEGKPVFTPLREELQRKELDGGTGWTETQMENWEANTNKLREIARYLVRHKDHIPKHNYDVYMARLRLTFDDRVLKPLHTKYELIRKRKTDGDSEKKLKAINDLRFVGKSTWEVLMAGKNAAFVFNLTDIKEPQKIIFSNKENKLEIKEGIS